jgi:hypothetical protein
MEPLPPATSSSGEHLICSDDLVFELGFGVGVRVSGFGVGEVTMVAGYKGMVGGGHRTGGAGGLWVEWQSSGGVAGWGDGEQPVAGADGGGAGCVDPRRLWLCVVVAPLELVKRVRAVDLWRSWSWVAAPVAMVSPELGGRLGWRGRSSGR